MRSPVHQGPFALHDPGAIPRFRNFYLEHRGNCRDGRRLLECVTEQELALYQESFADRWYSP